MLFFLLLVDVIVLINHLLKFLQTKNLIYGNASRTVLQLPDDLRVILTSDGELFKKDALEFLTIIRERNNQARRLCSNNLLDEKETLEHRVEQFCNNKTPFLKDLTVETNVAWKTDDKVMLVFNVFNTNTKLTEDQSWAKIN